MYQTASDTLIWILLLPLIGALVNGLLGRRLGPTAVKVIGSGVVLVAFLYALDAFVDLTQLVPRKRRLAQGLFTWIGSGRLQIELRLVIDQLSSVMTLIITGVGFLIHLYSSAYMANDRSIHRYFAYLNLFVFSMLLLVMGASLPIMFVGWEGVGVCSYLLIGFWFNKEANAIAGRKAFIVNRIGDFGFLLGIFLIWYMLGTLDFMRLDHMLGVQKLPLDPTLVTAATLLLFVGATGKSAQIPLYVWLPDAMAGPTPVSALIHAATMVTAGIYMIVRMASLFTLSPTTMGIIATIGAATALLAATIAIVQNDIKKVLAYSTVSQLGYMFLAVGVGAFTAGVFHLTTHAFFKALLFLGAGAVIHAMEHAHGANDPQDIRTMGGLWKPLRITATTFLIGTMAIAGIPGLSGFFSKDEILWKALSSELGGVGLWLVGTLVAGLTAFYMSRLFIRTFLGAYRGKPGTAEHLDDGSWPMSLPLIVLAVLSAVAGYVGLPHVFHVHNLLEEWLAPVLRYARPIRGYEHVAVGPVAIGEWAAMGISVAIAGLGIASAWFLYLKRPELPARIAAAARPAYLLLAGKWFVDELYQWAIIKPLRLFSEYVLFAFADRQLIDFAVEGSGRLARGAGAVLRTAQNGRIGAYLLYLLAGSLALLVLTVGR